MKRSQKVIKPRVKIRRISWDDIDRQLDFVNRLSKEDTFVMLSGEQLSRKDEVEYIANSFVQMETNNKVHLVAIIGKKLAGNAEIKPHEKKKKHVGTITIAIDKQFRGIGLGTRLLKQLIKEGGKQGFKLLTLSCLETNVAGIKVYENLGFKCIGTIPRSFLHKGKYVGESFFYLPVN